MGDVGLIEHEASKVQNSFTLCLFMLIASLIFLFMSLLVFIYFTLTEFLTSFMIVASFITIGFEFIILWPISCGIISLIYFFRRKVKFVNLSRKSKNFKHTHKAYSKSYITSTLSKKAKVRDEELEIGQPNDSDVDLENYWANWKNLHTSFEGLSDIS